MSKMLCGEQSVVLVWRGKKKEKRKESKWEEVFLFNNNEIPVYLLDLIQKNVEKK